MSTILRKLSSRKLWMAVAGIATGIALAFGADEGTIAAVAGAFTAAASVVTYIITEGKVDASGVKTAVESVQKAADLLGEDSVDTAGKNS